MSETNSLQFPDQTTGSTRSADAEATKAPDLAGHALFERIGVGGMGEVYRFRDDALHRDLALKILKAELHGDAAAEERFLREAWLTGSLQHPGIVPVHQLGRLADGRPCYTMKLVRGRTLADLIRDEPSGPERLPRLLAVVEKVCQAVAFAHSKGVLHRDLKPSNVMVGEFGEVQVMDWGLAKELSHGEPAAPPNEASEAAETVARTEEAEGLSRAGLALGTPAYMPPEQAAGDWDIVDERADVFAVGALLCEVLTGRPPYHGASRDDLLRRARRGEVAEALRQLEKCGADKALIELCRECLAAERLQRPRHAGVVAERLASYQAEVRERLRQAELERARVEVKALEERKRRRLRMALALAGLLLLFGGVAVWRHGQRRQAEADGAAAQVMTEVGRLREEARENPLSVAGYDKAVEAAKKAGDVARAGGASETVRGQADDLLAELKKEAEQAEKDRRLLARLLEARRPREGPKYRRDKDIIMALAEPTVEEQFASAFRDWGLDVDAVPSAEAVDRLKERPAAVVTEVIAALDEWASQRRVDRKPGAQWRRLADLAAALDEDLAAALDEDAGSRRRELRKILARGRLPVERGLAMLSAALRPVPLAVEVAWGQDRTRLRELAERIDPAGEAVLGLLTLTRALREAGEEALAERLLRAALTARPREVVLYHPLGKLLQEQEPPRWAEAVECYAAARALRPDLGVNLANALRQSGRRSEALRLLAWMAKESPYNPYLHFWRAYALAATGDLDGAIACYQKTLELDPKDVNAHNNLGITRYDKHDLDGAIACYRKTLELSPKYANAHNNLANALAAKGDQDGAIACYQRALEIDPKHSRAYNNLGSALYHKHDLGWAIACYQKALELDPKYANAHSNLGNALRAKGDLDGAIACYQKALEIDPKHVSARTGLGVILRAKGDLDGAIACYQKALEIDPKQAQVHYNLGNALRAKGDQSGAIACYQKTLELNPKDARAHHNLGNALSDKGDLDGAIVCYRKTLELDPKHAKVHNNLGLALSDKGDLDGAIAYFRKALELDPKYANCHSNLGLALAAKGDQDGAIACFQKTLELDSKHAEAHCNLGLVLRNRGRFPAAVARLRRGHELGSRRPGWRYPSAQLLRDTERELALDLKLSALLTGEATAANPSEAIALASLCQQPYKKCYAASARLYADAFAADAKLAADFRTQHRYNAAWSAALAATGKGEDARSLPDKVTVMFRRWALRWLHEDLSVYVKLSGENNPAANKEIQQKLTHWHSDPNLASVRDEAALERLPEGERTAWLALWREVDALAERVRKKDETTRRDKERENPKAKPEGRSLPPCGETGR